METQLSQHQLYKVHLYHALVMSVLLCGAETWTLLVADMNTLEAFRFPHEVSATDTILLKFV